MTRSGTADTVCLVTCRDVPELTADDRLLAEAFQDAGWRVEIAAWDDPVITWPDFGAVVVRSTWDYHRRVSRFRAWLEACEADDVRLWNPPGLIRWNLHKSYLLELGESGLPVVPTEIVGRGEPGDLSALLAARGWPEAVVKPAVAATAYRTFRTSMATAAGDQTAFHELLAYSDVLIQSFIAEIESAGEISFLFFAGRYSHAVLKRAKPGDFRVQSDYGGSDRPVAPEAALLEQARRIAAAIPQPWLYARIDTVDRGGSLVIMEVELIEPQLFFGHHPDAAARLAAAVRTM